jgi:hypothetical protein
MFNYQQLGDQLADRYKALKMIYERQSNVIFENRDNL